MVTSGTRFYDSSIDIFRRYNEKGEIIEEINRNENFSFSVYDLIEKIKITHKINLNDGELDRHVFRGIDKEINKPIYKIKYDINKNDGTYKYITVDGETGQILSEGNSQFL
jgi:hypothetical protein